MSLGKFDVLQKEILQMQFQFQQECIPVGCLPPAAVAVPGGLHQAPPLDQAPPGPGNPPGPGTPWDQAPPREQTPPGPGKNITLPQLRCGR